MARGIKRTCTDIRLCARCEKYFPRNQKYSDAQWETVRWCSRKCGAWNKGLTRDDDPRIAAYAEAVRISSTGRPSWSKGFTKHTHPSLAIVARKVSEVQKGKKINEAQRAGLAHGWRWGKGRTKETCPKIAKRSAHLAKVLKGRSNPEHSARMKALYAAQPDKHPNAIVAKKTKGKGFTHIEKIVADILDDQGVAFAFNVRIGTKWPDFSIQSHRLIIEADGEYWHQDAEKEAARDAYLTSLGWSVLHLTGKQLVNETDYCREAIKRALEHCHDRQQHFRTTDCEVHREGGGKCRSSISQSRTGNVHPSGDQVARG